MTHDARTHGDAVLARAAGEGERVVNVARLVFCVLVFARSAGLGVIGAPMRGDPRALLDVPVLLVAIAYSLFALRAAPGVHPPARAQVRASIALDAALCHASLLTDVLWPSSDYAGFLRMPDGGAILLMTLTAGFRLVPGAALFGGALNGASAAVLVGVDLLRNGQRVEYGTSEIALAAIFLAATVTLSSATASRTRRLVAESAAVATRLARVRTGLGTLLHDHHDARSGIASITLRADALARASSGGSPDLTRLAALAGQLQADLGEVTTILEGVNERTFGELAALDVPSLVAVGDAVAVAVAAATLRYPHVAIDARAAAACGVHVAFSGGGAALARVVANVVLNACQGDGESAASHVRLHVHVQGGRVSLAVRDDGPGFPAAVLAPRGRAPATTKADGSGLGLFAVERLLAASGGSLTCRNTGRGAEVIVELVASASLGAG